MKLLFLTQRFPYPPTRGDTLRAWNELEYLTRRHDVWLASVEHVAPRPEHVEVVRRRCREVAVAVNAAAGSLVRGALRWARGGSLTEGYFYNALLLRTTRRWADAVAFDAVLTYSSAMAPYAEALDVPRRVLDLVDVDSRKWAAYARRSLPPARWLYALEARRLAQVERRCLASHDVCLVVNERERAKLAALGARGRTGVVRTTVDLERYAPPRDPDGSITLANAPVVGMLGSMFYPPNVRAVHWFGRHVWPRVKAAVPAARWLIVGSRPVASVRAWGRQTDVKVTGFVADERPFLRQMRVCVNAVEGDLGVQSKLIVAMAAGKAAVVTRAAAGGIDYAGDPPFMIATAPETFADAVVRLLRDDALARAFAARARAVAEANYRVDEQVRLVERWLAGDNVEAHTGERAVRAAGSVRKEDAQGTYAWREEVRA